MNFGVVGSSISSDDDFNHPHHWRNGSEHRVLPDVEDLGIAFLGPYALSAFISAFETGIIITEKMAIKALVYFLTFVAIFQTGTTFAVWWKISVSEAAVPGWPQKIHTSLTTVLAAPVQLFLIWRCWHLLKRRWFFILPLLLLVIGTIISTIYVEVIIFRLQFQSKNTLALSLHAFFTCFIDIVVTSILLVFLTHSRSSIYTRRFRKAHLYLSLTPGALQLIVITWESAAPFVSYWAVFLQTILGKLYLISLFVTLEGRAKLANVTHPTHFPTLTNTSRHGETWSDPPDEGDRSDPTKRTDIPLTLVPRKIGVVDSTNSEGISSSLPHAQAV
ncbi:hypothetical protein B0F90DRAFT_1709792 [Multifurca ochricompacta]|uniref:Uncharacterized protein n=1 Tax=Multifurca ochricompacta TaxID=376703 RepID=A0AAD4M7W9_9AGAM|nr:hypothetical protein B0F90DRAFT_1709792 [Multifurca ochricompacta]